jgi:hypothetical protein
MRLFGSFIDSERFIQISRPCRLICVVNSLKFVVTL